MTDGQMTGTSDTQREPATAKAISPRGGARLAVVQALYEMDISGKGVLDALAEFEAFWIGQEVDGIAHPQAETAFFRDLLRGTVAEQRAIDPKLDQALAQGWPLRRIEIVLRAILRAGAYELMFRTDVPVGAAISAYVDVAHSFYTADEPGLVNAVLDRLAREVRPGEVAAPKGPGKGPGKGSDKASSKGPGKPSPSEPLPAQPPAHED
jgi:transcription antitermination protein NusB